MTYRQECQSKLRIKSQIKSLKEESLNYLRNGTSDEMLSFLNRGINQVGKMGNQSNLNRNEAIFTAHDTYDTYACITEIKDIAANLYLNKILKEETRFHILFAENSNHKLSGHAIGIYRHYKEGLPGTKSNSFSIFDPNLGVFSCFMKDGESHKAKGVQKMTEMLASIFIF